MRLGMGALFRSASKSAMAGIVGKVGKVGKVGIVGVGVGVGGGGGGRGSRPSARIMTPMAWVNSAPLCSAVL